MTENTSDTYRQRLAMQVEYAGTRFSGWQKQPGLRCVQSELETALTSIANHQVEVVCAGRTDTGVHAVGQIVHFDTKARRDMRGWLLGTNTLLPEDISVTWVNKVPQDFHARFTAVSRTYRYYIWNRFSPSAIYNGRALWVYHELDAAAMHRAAQFFLGEQDFTSVRGSDCQSNTPFRNVHSVTVKRSGDWVMVDICANAFLHHMVRNIVGSLLEVGLGKKSHEWIVDMLAQKDRTVAGITAGAEGLYFMQVDYPEKFALPEVSCSPLF